MAARSAAVRLTGAARRNSRAARGRAQTASGGRGRAERGAGGVRVAIRDRWPGGCGNSHTWKQAGPRPRLTACKKASQSLRPQPQIKWDPFFPGGVYLGKNTYRAAECRLVRRRWTIKARSGAQSPLSDKALPYLTDLQAGLLPRLQLCCHFFFRPKMPVCSGTFSPMALA